MMQFNYNGESSVEFYHGDEHLCFDKCDGDRLGFCICAKIEEANNEIMCWELEDGLL